MLLDLGLEDGIPDEKTVRAFREQLSKAAIEKALFSQFERFLQRRGLKNREGSLVDATLVEVPIRRDSKEVNEAVKAGKRYFGYKNHIRVDAATKLIREREVTPKLLMSMLGQKDHF